MGGYAHHSSFERPDATCLLWRYLDFAKFVDMLDQQALWFSRADTMVDPWEGALSPEMELARFRQINARVEELSKQRGSNLGPTTQMAASFTTAAAMRAKWRRKRSRTFLSCWYLADDESAAMWDLYAGRDGRGVAIQTTFGRLDQALPTDFDYAIFAGRVKYIDYRRDVIPVGNAYDLFLHKRRSFEHEREVRAVFDSKRKLDAAGVNVPVVLADLIEQVRVAPTAPAWFAALVDRTVQRYGLAVSTHQSDLMTGPL